jgi:hypothetical protein
MGIQDRDYMRERARDRRSTNARRPASSGQSTGMTVLVWVTAILVVLTLVSKVVPKSAYRLVPCGWSSRSCS